MARRRERDDGRGRTSTRPTDMPKAGWRDILLRTKREISDDNVDLVAAGVAFYGLLAIFPALVALISVYGLIADPNDVQQQLDTAGAFVPGGAQSILRDQLAKVTGARTDTLGLAAAGGILLAFWSASKGTKAFMTAMNIAYGEKEERGFLALNATAFGLTCFVIVLAIVALLGVAVVPAFIDSLGLGGLVTWLVTILRWPALAVVFAFALSVLYRYAPSRQRAQWRWVSPGSIAATCLWLVASIAFSIYVRNFSSYNETYGSLGAAVGMLMWFWLSAYIVMLGAELNAEMERQTRKDTTTGEPRPMGEREAVAADTLGESP